jgi:hypothetical protein
VMYRYGLRQIFGPARNAREPRLLSLRVRPLYSAAYITAMNILTINLLFNSLVFGLIAKFYVLPRLRELRPKTVLLPILLLHSSRHLGLMFLAPGATFAGISPQFAYPAAFGDLLTALLALAAIPAVARDAKGGRLLVWVFNVAGTLDLILAIGLGHSL